MSLVAYSKNLVAWNLSSSKISIHLKKKVGKFPATEIALILMV